MKIQFNFLNHIEILWRETWLTEVSKRRATGREQLLAYSKPLDKVMVSLKITISKIIQQPPPLPY